MLHIPTVTGNRGLDLAYEVALCSPSRDRPILIRGSILTIVDCHTRYLRNRPAGVNALLHYLWFCDFVKQNMHDPDLVFIAPDADWLGLDSAMVVAAWPLNAKCLAIPGTMLFPLLTNVHGHALVPGGEVLAHPEWVHHFSREYTALQGYAGFQSYDSVSQND